MRRPHRSLHTVLTLPLFFMLSALPATAQLRAGLRAGLSMAAMVTDPEDLGFRTGFIGGGWLRAPLGGPIALQIEAYYVQKGYEEGNRQVATWLQLDYFEFPVLLTFLLNRGEEVMVYFATGGALSVERGCEIGASVAGHSASIDCSQTGLDDGPGFYPENLDVGLVLGTGLEFDLGRVILTLDGRADLGLKDAMGFWTGGVNGEYYGGQNAGFEVMAGIAFHLR